MHIEYLKVFLLLYTAIAMFMRFVDVHDDLLIPVRCADVVYGVCASVPLASATTLPCPVPLAGARRARRRRVLYFVVSESIRNGMS